MVGGKALGAVRAWTLADHAWNQVKSATKPVMLLLDCDSHSARLDDERLVLSEYLFNLSLALACLKGRGLSTVILGKAGGGVYVAFAAPAPHVAIVHGGQIQVLPGGAIASILGENIDSKADFDDYRNAGVAEQELRLGLLPE
jgi:Malonate decarboxylase gamma subunit (MdcE)